MMPIGLPSSLPRERSSTDRGALAVGIVLWCGSLLIAALRILLGSIRTDVWPVYERAAQNWSARGSLYQAGTIDGFQYFPQAALVYGCFAWLGTPAAGIVWRAAGWGLLAHAMWRIARLLSVRQPEKLFLLVTAFALVPSMGSLFNGQSNLILSALMVHVVVELARQRWGSATIWMMIGLAIKPLMLLLIFLACVQYPRMRWTALGGLVVLAIAPLALAPISYVWAQDQACFSKLVTSAQPDRLFENVRGLAHVLGWYLPPNVFHLLQVSGALAAVSACAAIRKRWQEPAAGLGLLAVAAAYLMLFNPRTQANSYVIAAPGAALAAAVYLQRRYIPPALAMLFVLLCWSANAVAPVVTELWLKPLGAIVFAALLGSEIVRQPRSLDEENWRAQFDGRIHHDPLCPDQERPAV